MEIFGLVSRNFWLICLGISGYNYFAATRRAAIEPSAPAKAEELRHLRLSFGVASIFPWLVMGYGHLVGGVPSVWHYFRPQDLNPYVLAWIGSGFVLSLAFAYWVFFRNGAKKTVEFRLFEVAGLRGNIEFTEGRVKLFAAIGPFFIALWVVGVVLMDAPIPK